MDDDTEVRTPLRTLLFLTGIEEELRTKQFKTEKARDRQQARILANAGRLEWELRLVQEYQRKREQGY